MRKIIFHAAMIACAAAAFSFSANVFRGFKKNYLWKDVPAISNPDETILYSPEISLIEKSNPNKTAVVICPGGSYHHLGMTHEGFATARWFLSQGAVPFVLQYRVAGNGNHHPAMLEDIQMAIKFIRENSAAYGISRDKVGAIGFSAGGHLVTMAAARGNQSELAKLGVETDESVRPNFSMPIYPVVSMQDDIGHKWSRKSLLGKNQGRERKDEFSMELQIPRDMVPSYILACRDDPVVMFENSVRLDAALSEKGVPHRFAVYEKGGHGFGMKDGKFMRRTRWNEDLKSWLKEIGMLD